MMGRFEDRFASLRREGRKAFMPFVTACDPSPAAAAEIVLALEKAGADAVELGFAYSDPIADGPVIQNSYASVLRAGFTVEDAFDVARTVRSRSQIPLAGMVSYSIAWKRSPAEFARDAASSGIDALIIPDLPPEESDEMRRAAGSAGLGLVFLVTPTTRPERVKVIAEASRPFIYYVSVVGTTGARSQLPPELASGVARVKSLTSTPVVVGFGVSNPEQASAVARIADGVIVGSAIVEVVTANRNSPQKSLLDAVSAYSAPLAAAVHT